MEFHRWQAKLLCDLRIFDLPGLLQRQAFDTFSHVRARGNGTPAAKRFELDIGDNAQFIDSNLEFHDVATSAQRVRVNNISRQGETKSTYAGAPTSPVPTSKSFLLREPT
jgi:hypothetical protein